MNGQMSTLNHYKNNVIFEEGEKADCFYFLAKGELVIQKKFNKKVKDVMIISPFKYFGLDSFIGV